MVIVAGHDFVEVVVDVGLKLSLLVLEVTNEGVDVVSVVLLDVEDSVLVVVT